MIVNGVAQAKRSTVLHRGKPLPLLGINYQQRMRDPNTSGQRYEATAELLVEHRNVAKVWRTLTEALSRNLEVHADHGQDRLLQCVVQQLPVVRDGYAVIALQVLYIETSGVHPLARSEATKAPAD